MIDNKRTNHGAGALFPVVKLQVVGSGPFKRLLNTEIRKQLIPPDEPERRLEVHGSSLPEGPDFPPPITPPNPRSEETDPTEENEDEDFTPF
jgi:hypothetical protein